MSKNLCFLTLLVLVLSCNQRKNNFSKDIPTTKNFLRSFDDTIVYWKKNNNTDSVLKYIDLKCREALNANDNTQLIQAKFDAYNYLYSKNDLDRAGEYADSILTFTPALSKDTSLLGIVIKTTACRGLDLEELGRHTAAASMLEKYIALINQYKKSNPGLEPYVFHSLGIIYTRYGDYKKACNFFDKEAGIWKQQKNFEYAASVIFNYCIALREIKEFDSAIRISKSAIDFPLLSSKRKAILYLITAECYLDKNDITSSNNYLSEAGFELNKINDSAVYAEKISELYKLKGDIFLKQNSVKESISFYQKALYWYLKANPKLRSREKGKLYFHIGNAHLNKNEPDSAIYYYHKALYTVTNVNTNDIFSLPAKKELYAENTIMEALDAKAKWMTNYFAPAEKQKYFQCAVDCYDLSFEVERKLLLNFSYDESKIRVLKESRQRSEKAIALCYTLYKETKDDQWIEKAFRFAERNKAFVVLESIRRNLAASQVAQHDTLFQKVQQLQMEYSFAEKSLLETKNSNDTSELKKLEKGRNKADEQLQLAKTSLYQNNSGYRQLMEKEDSVSISMVQKLLPGDKAALIEYFIGDSTSYAIVAAANSYRFVTINNDHLAGIDSFQYFFRNKNNIPDDPDNYQQKANAVYTAWLKPCLEGLAANKLLIIPDDKLTILPFDALITNISANNNLRSWSYLVKEYKLDLGYSVSTLLKQNTRRENEKGITAFAPGFVKGERNMPSLPFTAEEIDNIKKESKAVLYKDKDATLTQFRRAADESGIIHIASHASADNTGMIPAIEFIDSTLLLNELYAMQVNADLVVLSACQTGIGKIEKSEGAMSLARGFYYAGAKNIITSLWSINDHSTAMLFKDFYNNINKGNYSYALYKAKKDYLSAELANDKYSPYYWAGFICIGVDDYIQPQKNNTWLWDLWIAGIFILSLILIVRSKRNKKRTSFYS